MQWSDEGIVLGVRKHGESSVILEVMTRDHGRHMGLVQGGRSKAQRPVLQPGNSVQVTWRARLDEHLGNFHVEGIDLRAARFIPMPLALYGLATLSHFLRVLPERDPHEDLYEAAVELVDNLDDPELAPTLFARFELALLADLGFGLDLGSCAATGRTDDLAYVSPKSGRAVSSAAGEPYKDRLFKLPGFLIGRPTGNRPSTADIQAGFALTEFFLHQSVFEPRGQAMPAERTRFIALATAEEE
ncbi:DNA repair protein RecO [Microvirga sp. 2MCAF38]|uniref:DNA repair protein RecO n=1 Tax=Microvirga sp. 2MCAF38 TaxID=3232989 RepID=UPI003F9D6601